MVIPSFAVGTSGFFVDVVVVVVVVVGSQGGFSFLGGCGTRSHLHT